MRALAGQRLRSANAFSWCAARRQHTASSTQRSHSLAGVHTAFAVLSGIACLERMTPKTVCEALSGKDGPKWKASMDAELQGVKDQNTWQLVPRASLPKDANVIKAKWVFKIKTDELGAITKYKARITPKGYMQKEGIDYFEVFANTGKYKSMRVLLSLAASEDLELFQLDVPQAFTQADLDEVIYMEMPEGYEEEGMVCKLLKALYGLKQAPRQWYLLISRFLKDMLGLVATVSDPCLFYKRTRSSRYILLFLFVDDMQIAVHKTDVAEWREMQQLLKERFNISDLGESKYMLGMRITRDRHARIIKLDQELYITKALEKFGMTTDRSDRTPAVKLDKDDPRYQAAASMPADLKVFQEKVGTLLYASISTRPDIAFAVNKLTQKMTAPMMIDMQACDRVFRYLAGTTTLGLWFGRQQSRATTHVAAYADSDWASDHETRRSTTGWIATVNGDPVSWASKRQKVVAQSTCEAELYAEAAAINEVKWLSELLGEIGHKCEVPIVYGDNQSAQALTRNGIKSERTKHIAIKYAFIHDEVDSGRVRLEWIPTREQLADMLTKALSAPLLSQLRSTMLCC